MLASPCCASGSAAEQAESVVVHRQVGHHSHIVKCAFGVKSASVLGWYRAALARAQTGSSRFIVITSGRMNEPGGKCGREVEPVALELCFTGSNTRPGTKSKAEGSEGAHHCVDLFL